jgi:hypothetical protein
VPAACATCAVEREAKTGFEPAGKNPQIENGWFSRLILVDSHVLRGDPSDRAARRRCHRFGLTAECGAVFSMRLLILRQTISGMPFWPK